MSPKQRFSSLMLFFIYVLFFLSFIYVVLTLLNKRSNQSRMCCGTQCIGNNTSCPCCRRIMLQNDINNRMIIRPNNEYFQPAIGSDFTQYLDQVRKNQLKFSNQ